MMCLSSNYLGDALWLAVQTAASWFMWLSLWWYEHAELKLVLILLIFMNWTCFSNDITIKQLMLDLYAAEGFVAFYIMLFIDSMQLLLLSVSCVSSMWGSQHLLDNYTGSLLLVMLNMLSGFYQWLDHHIGQFNLLIRTDSHGDLSLGLWCMVWGLCSWWCLIICFLLAKSSNEDCTEHFSVSLRRKTSPKPPKCYAW
jgi:hypothetical protein